MQFGRIRAVLSAALLGALALGARAESVSYRYAVYNTDGVPADGIKAWKTGVTNATAVTDSSSTVTWGGTAGQDYWYVVSNATVTISGRITCTGNIHLILADGCTLTASAGITVGGSNTLSIYGQKNGTGALNATSSTANCAGIGGDSSSGSYNGGVITIHGGTVTATGGTNAAGIGGGRYSIRFGAYTAGTGSNITINGGTVTATGGSAAAGIGGSYGSYGTGITINGGTVTATGGSSGWSGSANGIGNGYNSSSSSGIYAAASVTVKAGTSASPTTEIEHTAETDLAQVSNFKKRYVTAAATRYAVTVAASERGTLAADRTQAVEFETVTLTGTPAAGFALKGVTVAKTDDPATTIEVTRTGENEFTFTMPACAVTATPDFGYTVRIATAPTAVAHTTCAVYTNGVLSADGIVWSNQSACVVYTCDAGGPEGGYYFADWSTVSTNELDTTVDPAVCVTAPDRVYSGEDELPLGEFNFSTKTFSRAEGLSLGKYLQLTILLSREIEGESVTLPTVAGYTLDTSISTDYSYVINIEGDGKTSAEIASEYIRHVVFANCRDQLVRCLLSWKKSENKAFFYEGTSHYYQYIPFASANEYSWTNCYKKARAMTYMGRTGYLATITSYVEDKLAYKATGHCVGWLGGTSCVAGGEDGEMYYNAFEPDSSSGHWYWACGPERGQEFFDWAQESTSCSNAIYARNAEKGYYFNWDCLGTAYNAQREPNGTLQQSKYYERFLTTLGFGYGYNTEGSVDDGKLGTDVYGWNDLKEDGNVGLEAKWDVLGYLVEFGDRTVGDSGENTYVRGMVVTERRIHAPVVIYDAGEGEFPNGETTNAVIHLDAGAGYELPTNLPTRAGYHLKGWYTNLADAATAVMAGSPLYTLGDHRVYALWAEGGYRTVDCVTNDVGGTIEVPLPETELASRGGDANTFEPNGNRVWENIVLGLSSNRVVATGARQNDDEGTIAVVAENLDIPPADTGFAVTYHLDHVSADGRVRGAEESRAAQMNGLWIDLSKVVTNDYYKVRVVVSNEVFVREYVATNTMGVLKQHQIATNLIVATPWGRLAPLEDLDIPVSYVLKTATLDAGDELRVYNPGASAYESWILRGDRTWERVTTVKVDSANAAPQIVQASDPDEATVPRGSGLWLCRKESRKGRPYYLFGQVNGDDSKFPIVRGSSLAGATGVANYDLNAHVTGATDADEIVIPGTNDVPRVLTYRQGSWGYWATGREKTVTFMGETFTTRETVWVSTNSVIRPGTGYWLHNTSGKVMVK